VRGKKASFTFIFPSPTSIGTHLKQHTFAAGEITIF